MTSVEIEIASGCAQQQSAIELLDVASQWSASIVSDGSLPSTGFEVCTAPAFGDNFADQIVQFCNAFAEGSAKVDSTCGLHVHVDARDADWYSISRLLRLYMLLENDIFFAMQPPSRQNSSYCVRVQHNRFCMRHLQESVTKSRTHIQQLLYGPLNRSSSAVRKKREFSNDESSKYDKARYDALNLHSWVIRGTIEYRHGSGSTDMRKIQMWSLLCATFTDFALKLSESEFIALCGSAIKNLPYDFANSVNKEIICIAQQVWFKYPEVIKFIDERRTRLGHKPLFSEVK